MEPRKVHWYKDFSTKFIFLFTGIIVLIGLNAIPWLWISDSPIRRHVIVWTLFLGWIFRRMRRIITKLYYLFSSNGDITIVLPNKKQFHLSESEIISKIEVDKLSWRTGRGIKYLPRKNEVHFTTSNSHLLKIAMKDGRVIVISPREYQ